MIRTLVLVLLLFPLSALAQDHINKSRTDLKKELDKFIEENKAKSPTLIESGTTLTLTVMAPGTEMVSHVFTFDTAGKCNAEKIIAACDSCWREELNLVLEKKNYQWKKINENQYISKYSDQLMIELPVESKDFYITIFRAQWTKEVYDILIKN